MSAKHEVQTPLNARIIKVFFSCHGSKVSIHHLLLLPQWITPPNVKFIYFQTAMLNQYASVAMVIRFQSSSQHSGSFLM